MRKSSEGGNAVARSTAGGFGSGTDFLPRLKVLECDGTAGTSVSSPSRAFFRERKGFIVMADCGWLLFREDDTGRDPISVGETGSLESSRLKRGRPAVGLLGDQLSPLSSFDRWVKADRVGRRCCPQAHVRWYGPKMQPAA